MATATADGTIWRSSRPTGPVEGDGDIFGAPPAQRRRLSYQQEVGEAVGREQEAKRLLMILSLPL